MPITADYSMLIGAVVIPALAQAEQSFAAALQRISVEDLARLASVHGLAHAAKRGQPE